tara:strand:+ start:108 stop:281 length:174 start_codon:yes stop_codon:yes gene_type:complete
MQNLEKLTMLEEVKLVVILQILIEEKENSMKQTSNDFLKEMYANDIHDLKIILNKLK